MTPEKRKLLEDRLAKMDSRVKMANLFKGLLEDSLADPETTLSEFMGIARQAFKYRHFAPEAAGDTQSEPTTT